VPFVEIDSPYDGAVVPPTFPMEGDLIVETSERDKFEVWCKSKPESSGGAYSGETQASFDATTGGWTHSFTLTAGSKYELVATAYKVNMMGMKTFADADTVNNVSVELQPDVGINTKISGIVADAAAPAALIRGTYNLAGFPGGRVVVMIAQRSRKRKKFRPRAVFDAIMTHDGPISPWRVDGKLKPGGGGGLPEKRLTAMALFIDVNGHVVAFTSRVNF
jgi:hypothetical protein